MTAIYRHFFCPNVPDSKVYRSLDGLEYDYGRTTLIARLLPIFICYKTSCFQMFEVLLVSSLLFLVLRIHFNICEKTESMSICCIPSASVYR